MDDEIMVSVSMITYNHAKYIKQALDSILMQKVNFKYEIVIGDDCSPDNTQDIIKQYVEKYPHIIKPILRQKNIGAPNNFYDTNKTCKGKYIAGLEGDDYWIDENKLQLQVDFLENHPECVSVAHRHEIVDINGVNKSYSNKNQKLDRYFNKNDAIRYKTELLHLNSLMYRNFFFNSNDKYVIFKDSNKFGTHSLMIFLLATMSKIYIMERPMSAWRMVIDLEGTNYTSVVARNPVEDNINQFIKYKNYRDYFTNKYDFNCIVQERFVICIVKVIKSDMDISKKIRKTMNLYKILNFNDRLKLPVVIIGFLTKRMTRKHLYAKQ